MIKKTLPLLIASFVFFSLGFATASFIKNPLFSPFSQTSAQKPEEALSNQEPTSPQITSGNLPSVLSTPQPATQAQSQSPRTGKYIIVASTPLVADQTQVETGEQVNFNITLKNKGTKKKFLTHICFNHSGGQTFGCVLNKNLFPEESFNLNNGMIFTSPGRYTVSVTWSQDGVNFYPPLNSNTVTIAVE